MSFKLSTTSPMFYSQHISKLTLHSIEVDYSNYRHSISLISWSNDLYRHNNLDPSFFSTTTFTRLYQFLVWETILPKKIRQLPTLLFDDLYLVPLKSSIYYRENIILFDDHFRIPYTKKAILFCDTHNKT